MVKKKSSPNKLEGGILGRGKEGAPIDWWRCLLVAWLILLTGGVIIAIIWAVDFHWVQDKLTNNLVSRRTNQDVEIRSGNDLIIHDKIIHSGSDVMAEKIQFTPVLPIGPTGSDFIFGDQSTPYSRLQAGVAIGFRLGTPSFLMPPGVLLGEPDLKMLIEPFGVHVASIFVPFFGIFIPSDERIKTDITDMDSTEALQNVLKLQPKTYYYIDEWHQMLGENTQEERGEKRRGFIAQQVKEVFPHSVKENLINLNGETIEDFNELRKEDIVTDVVSALQEMYAISVLETAYNIFESGDPLQSSLNKRDPPQNRTLPTHVPSRVNVMKECIADTSPSKIRAKCICESLIEFCDVNPSLQLCQPGHPLLLKCGL